MAAVRQETDLGVEFWKLYRHREVEKYIHGRDRAKIARATGISVDSLRDQIENNRLPRDLQTALALADDVGITMEELARFYPKAARFLGVDLGDSANPGKRDSLEPAAA